MKGLRSGAPGNSNQQQELVPAPPLFPPPLLQGCGGGGSSGGPAPLFSPSLPPPHMTLVPTSRLLLGQMVALWVPGLGGHGLCPLLQDLRGT